MGYAPPPVENACTRTVARIVDALNVQDLDRIAREFAPDFVRLDHRPGLRSEIHGWDEMAANLTVWMDLGWRCVQTPIAVRGDSYALQRLTFNDPSSFEIEYLTVNESREDGRLIWGANHDGGDLRTAIAELDARWIASGDVPVHVRSVLEIMRAYNDRDETRTTAMSDPDAVTIDHGPIGGGEIHGIDESVRWNTTMWDLSPDMVAVVRRIDRVKGPAVLVSSMGRGTSQDGVELAFDNALVYLFGDDGRLVRLELFVAERYADAVARFEELAG